MNKWEIKQMRKRNGSIVLFEPERVKDALYDVLIATNTGGEEVAKGLTGKVLEIVEAKFYNKVPPVKDVQNVVERS
jgi:hypothetical protein